MRLPSVKTLSRLSTERAKEIRRILEERKSVRDTMEEVSDLIGGFGHEEIPRGRKNAPRIQYVNMGDTYSTTLLYVRGKYEVGDWGSIVEMGIYD